MAMDKRAEHLIQIFEQIGVPLVEASVKVVPGDDPKKHAQIVAELLTHSVKLGIDVSSMTDFGNTDGDSVRIALSAIAAKFVSALYRHHKKAPEPADFEKIKTALQAVLSFSENFTVSSDNPERLKALQAKGAGLDAHQMAIQYLHGFMPVVNAVGEFSFGQQQQKLVMDISIRLTAEAKNLRKKLLPNASEEDEVRADLALLNALISVFVACYEAEVEKVSQSGQAPAGNALDFIWSAYEIRVGIVEALGHSLIGGAGDKASSSSGSQAPTVQESTVVVEQTSPSKIESPSQPAKDDPAQKANPMAMFSKKHEENTAAKQVDEPSVASSPPPKEPSNDTDSSDEDKAQSANPMSFFKKGG